MKVTGCLATNWKKKQFNAAVMNCYEMFQHVTQMSTVVLVDGAVY
jgi:hypothetical protein